MLVEEKRLQLDSIVQEMTKNGEKDDTIQFVVNDFKNRHSTEESQESFLEKTGKILDMFFGGGKVGEAIGTGLAKGITAGVRGLGLIKGASAMGKISSGMLAGELFDIASNLQQGKMGKEALTPGIGALIGGGIPAASVAKNIVVRFGEGQAPRVINSLIKPLAKDFSYGKNPGRAVAEEGIVANNFDDLIENIRANRQKNRSINRQN